MGEAPLLLPSQMNHSPPSGPVVFRTGGCTLPKTLFFWRRDSGSGPSDLSGCTPLKPVAFSFDGRSRSPRLASPFFRPGIDSAWSSCDSLGAIFFSRNFFPPFFRPAGDFFPLFFFRDISLFPFVPPLRTSTSFSPREVFFLSALSLRALKSHEDLLFFFERAPPLLRMRHFGYSLP